MSLLFFILQGSVVQKLNHGPSSKGGSPCITYSLSYHPSKVCMLTVGSYGPVRVWVGPENDEEDNESS